LTQSKLPITTDYYQLGVGKDEHDKPFYQVMNIESGVVEYDDYILPRSIEALYNLTEKLDEVYTKQGTDKQLPLTLVTKGETDGEGSLH